MPRRPLLTRHRWTAGFALLLTAAAVSGCGVKQIKDSGAAGTAATQTGCLQAAGASIKPRTDSLLTIRDKTSKGTIDVTTLQSVGAARKLGENLDGGSFVTGRQLVIVRGQVDGKLLGNVRRCLVGKPPPPDKKGV